MMSKLMKLILSSFLLFPYLSEANNWELSLAQLKDELNYKLDYYIKAHYVFEKRIEDLFNQLSEFREEVFGAYIESFAEQIEVMKVGLEYTTNVNEILRNKINYLERNPGLDNKVCHLKTVYSSLFFKSLVPIGFIYTQLPGQPEPRFIWPSIKWVDISEGYSNLFFRVIGNKSKSFGEYQEEDSPRLIEVHSHLIRRNGTWTQPETIDANNQWSRDIYSGDLNNGQHTYINFKVSSGEVRPGNKAIRIWERVSD